MSEQTTYQSFSSSRGTTLVPRARALALARALARGQHPWGPGAPYRIALPEWGPSPHSFEEILEEARGLFVGEWAPRRPMCAVSDGVFLWRPLGALQESRWVEIRPGGRISWSTGTGAPSRFIGGCLLAAAGPHRHLPTHGPTAVVRVAETRGALGPLTPRGVSLLRGL